MIEHFYFGCYRETGHYLFASRGHGIQKVHSSSSLLPVDFPCLSGMLDGGFLPPNLQQAQGRASFCHLNGWTIIAFWDRSVDSRGKSHSTFLMRGIFEFEMAKSLSVEAFPEIWKRFTFPVFLPEVKAQ